MALHWLRVGHCTQLESHSLRGAPRRKVEFPSYAGLLGHPDHGWTLVDTGYADHFFRATESLPERLYRRLLPPVLPAAEELAHQLKALGVSPSDIRRVVVTHFHGDHIAGLRDYPHARIVAGAAGVVQIRSTGRLAGVTRGLLPGLLPDDAVERLDAAEDLPLVALVGLGATVHLVGRDLLGDRSIVLIDLPGHLPGHLGVLVTTTAGRQVLLAGDAAWSSRAVTENRPPARVALARFDSPATALTTLTALHQLSAADHDLLVVPTHCEAAARELVRS